MGMPMKNAQTRVQARRDNRPRGRAPQHGIPIIQQSIGAVRVDVAPEIRPHQQRPVSPCRLGFQIRGIAGPNLPREVFERARWLTGAGECPPLAADFNGDDL